MWNIWALTLAASTTLGLFALSLALAKRDTIDELRNLFDYRLVRRAARSKRQFGLGTFMWLTAYIAVVIPVFQTLGGLPVVYLVIPLLTITFLLARVAVVTLAELGVRRIQPRRQFPTSEVKSTEQSNAPEHASRAFSTGQSTSRAG